MKKTKYTVVKFELPDGFYVDVFEINDTVEFFLYQESSAIKLFMFGVQKKSFPNEDDWEELISSNIDEYLESYITEYME